MVNRKRAVSPHTTGNPDVDRALQEVWETLRRMQTGPFADGADVISVDVPAATMVRVSHKLGRTPKAWWPANWRSPAPTCYETARDSRFITLVGGATASSFQMVVI